MKDVLAIAAALADESRLRALLALRHGELCLCHLIGLLKLAPSTASKHLSILKAAGLVETRRDGKWVHYRLAGTDEPASPAVRSALKWISQAMGDNAQAAADAKALKSVCKLKPEELCACYRN